MSDVGTVVWAGAPPRSDGRAEAGTADEAIALEQAGFDVELCPADSVVESIEGDAIDCLVCDAERCPDPVEIVRAVRGLDRNIGIVVLARTNDETLAHRAVAAGATEYVPPRLADQLVAATERAVESASQSRKRSRAAAQLNALFEDAPDPIAEYEFRDGEPVIRSVNRAFVDTFGFERDVAVGSPLNELIVPEGKESEARALDERVRTAAGVNAEIERETTDGLREFLFRNIGLETETGTDGFAVYIDITEQRARERRLQEQNDRLNEFASVISHDLRNPMGAVKHRIEMARQTGSDEHLDDALAALGRMDELLRDLLNMAKQGKQLGQTEPLSLETVARTAWNHIATGEARLRVVEDRTIVADSGRLTQMFENLFINAVKHGSTVDDTGIEVRVGVDDECLFVEDDGRGIPVEERQNVFESGYTTANDGTGYGLAIVRQVTRAHGWNVCVTESVDGGARFEFRDVAFPES